MCSAAQRVGENENAPFDPSSYRMNKESIVFAVSGTFFGLLVGWVIGSQQGGSAPAARPPAAPAAASSANAAPAPPPLDETRVSALKSAAAGSPKDAKPRVELANAYFDAERYPEAIQWYDEALELDPRNVDASTDLAVCYYYANQPDRALKQFELSLAINPDHLKTNLNMGIVRAFGKQDLAGAAKAWERVIQLAPDSPEGRAARQALNAMKGAHPDLGAAPKGQ